MTQAPEDYPAHERLQELANKHDATGEYYSAALGHERIKAILSEHEALLTDNARLKAQLPEGMKHCTIVFKECSLGHGWLTATNWVRHGCPTCEKEALRAVMGELVEAATELMHETIDLSALHPIDNIAANAINRVKQALSRANQSNSKR